MPFYRQHHQAIWQIIGQLNLPLLAQHGIAFGGGTRIAMELEEYRESSDIDFLCPGRSAYRAVREQITSSSLGDLIMPNADIELLREVRADRDAVRTFVTSKTNRNPIKLEFINYEIHRVVHTTQPLFGQLPVIDRFTCFVSKLLANADRYNDPGAKDIFDLCMMREKWGAVPELAWFEAFNVYSKHTVLYGLERALNKLCNEPDAALNTAINTLQIEPLLAKALIQNTAIAFLHAIAKRS